MATIELSLALFLAVAIFGALSKWITLPLPIILVAGGISLSFVPGLNAVRLDPAIFFLLFVPPLLFADGWLFPKREFASYLRPILLLAFGLVAATVVVVGLLMHWLIPSLPLAAAFALGAIVSPTDAVATAAVTERHLILCLAAATIVLTLAINGLSLPLLIRALGLRLDGGAERVELHALRDAQVIDEQTLRAIESEIDHAETLVIGVPRGGHG